MTFVPKPLLMSLITKSTQLPHEIIDIVMDFIGTAYVKEKTSKTIKIIRYRVTNRKSKTKYDFFEY